jgi:hypothetical protein
MPLALTFTGKVDPTAVATLVLAVITLISVIVGGFALHRNKTEIALSRREVEEAHRPVVIPWLQDPIMPGLLRMGHLGVPIRNIGSGPGLNVEVTVTPRDPRGEEAWRDQTFTITILGVAVNDQVKAEIEIPNLGGLPGFDLRVTYSDVAGKQWVTVAKYVDLDDRYTGMSIRTATKP